jgi:DNA invertase Pin-like site-specific DNA recombinase
MIVVAYVRMSTRGQEHSPEQQREAIAAYAKQRGYKISREYADLGVSGDKAEKRPQFRQMIADGAAGKFGRILCYDRSRFGRFDSLEAGQWITPLRDAGVVLETVADGTEDWDDFGGRIVAAVAAEAKHQFLQDLSRNVVRGMTSKMSEGRGYCGPTPYGYRRETTVEGRSRVSTLKPDPEQAAVVRRIFKAYCRLDGSLGGIATALNEERVPTARRGAEWRANAVKRILENEVYVGTNVWGRRQKGRYFTRDGGSVRKRRRGEKTQFVEPMRQAGTVPALIDRETFDAAQRMMADRAGSHVAVSTVSPLSGIVVCRRCGSTMHSDGNRLRCSGSMQYRRGGKCPAVRVPMQPILAAVAKVVQERLGSPAARKKLAQELERRAAAQMKQPGNTRAALVARRDRLAADVEAGLEKIHHMPTGLVADYAAGLERKALERDRLTAEIDAAPKVRGPKPAIVMTAGMQKLAQAIDAVIAGGRPALVNAALKALPVKVRIDPARGPIDVEITVGDECTTGSRCAHAPPLLPVRFEWRGRVA